MEPQSGSIQHKMRIVKQNTSTSIDVPNADQSVPEPPREVFEMVQWCSGWVLVCIGNTTG